MGVTGLLPFLQKASRPANVKEFAGQFCFGFRDGAQIILLQAQLLPLTSMFGFTRVPSGAFKQWWTAVPFIEFLKCVCLLTRQSFNFLNETSVLLVALRLWRREDQLMPM